MKRLNDNWLAILALLGVSLAYASFGIIVRALNNSFTLWQQMYLWTLLASLLAFIIFRKQLQLNLPLKQLLIIALRGLAFYVIGTSLWNFGIINAKYSTVAILNTIPTTELLALFILREKFTKIRILALLTLVFGMVLVALRQLNQEWQWHFQLAELAVLISLLFYAGSYLLRKKQAKKINDQTTTFFMLLSAGIILLTLSFASGERITLEIFNFSNIVWLTLMAGVNVTMMFLMNYGLKNLKIFDSGIIFNSELPFGLLISILLYREWPTLTEFTGGILILFSVVLISLKSAVNSNNP